MPEDWTFWETLAANVAYAALILGAGWYASNLTRGLLLRVLRVRRLDEALVRFLSSIAQMKS